MLNEEKEESEILSAAETDDTDAVPVEEPVNEEPQTSEKNKKN